MPIIGNAVFMNNAEKQMQILGKNRWRDGEENPHPVLSSGREGYLSFSNVSVHNGVNPVLLVIINAEHPSDSSRDSAPSTASP